MEAEKVEPVVVEDAVGSGVGRAGISTSVDPGGRARPVLNPAYFLDNHSDRKCIIDSRILQAFSHRFHMSKRLKIVSTFIMLLFCIFVNVGGPQDQVDIGE